MESAKTGISFCDRIIRNSQVEIGLTYRQYWHVNRRKWGSSGLKWNSLAVWTIGWKCYSEMNQESALVNTIKREVMSGDVQTQPIKIITWRKRVNFHSHSWYRIACHIKGQRRWQSLFQQSIYMCTKKIQVVSSWCNVWSDGLRNCSMRVRTPVTLLRSLSGKYPWARYEPPYPPSYGLDSTTTVLLGE